MRTWHITLIPYLCKKHLVGMHGEIHKHRHNFVKRHSIAGRIAPIVQIEPDRMKLLHDAIVPYLKNHKSPYELPDLSYLPKAHRSARVDIGENIRTLTERCVECARRLEERP